MWLSVGADYRSKVLWDEVIQVFYVPDGQTRISQRKLKFSSFLFHWNNFPKPLRGVYAPIRIDLDVRRPPVLLG